MRSQQQQTTTIQSIPDVQNQEYLNRLCHSREEMGMQPSKLLFHAALKQSGKLKKVFG